MQKAPTTQRCADAFCRSIWAALRGCRLPFFRRFHVGPFTMGRAIRFLGNGRFTAEMEFLGARFAFRPTAHPRPEGAKTDDFRRFRFLLDRRSPFREAEPVNFSDDGVFGDAEAVSDLARGQPLIPQGDQGADARWGPFDCHFWFFFALYNRRSQASQCVSGDASS